VGSELKKFAAFFVFSFHFLCLVLSFLSAFFLLARAFWQEIIWQEIMLGAGFALQKTL
jgi:hypothetical protein